MWFFRSGAFRFLRSAGQGGRMPESSFTAFTAMRPVIYQLFVRHFSNACTGGQPWGSKEENGCGTFAGVNDAALQALAEMGVTHVWLTGVLRHATQTDYSAAGLPADPAVVVKGRAGSPYAVTDYFDLDPDLAENPADRRAEFAALLARCRRHGLTPLMDFIPNHVSRTYASRVRPECAFGACDDTHTFFARHNAFFYLSPHGGEDEMRLPEGGFEPERGRGRVTGNNAATWHPSAHDWYETVKLNYGCDYTHGPHAAAELPGLAARDEAVPRTWLLMDAVLAWWQEMGVGGFRCDMAHLVPPAFWRWAIARARLRDENTLFLAEAYNDHMSLCAGDVHRELLAAGFHGIYDSPAYDTLRGIVAGTRWANDLDRHHHAESKNFYHGVRYLENHDELRLPRWTEQGSRDKGEAPTSAAVPYAALCAAQFATTAGPVLVYNGQEVGEAAEGPGGYGGDNGRTSIFDYTSLPHLQHWANGGRYDGAAMTEEERELRGFTCRLLPLLQHPALAAGTFYGLNWANRATPGFGRAEGESVSGHRLYAFLRHARKARATVLVLCNFSAEETYETSLHIPLHAQEWAGKKPAPSREYSFLNLLDPAAQPLSATSEELATTGLPLRIPAGGTLVLEWC